MGWWKADPVPATESPTQQPSFSPPAQPAARPVAPTSTSDESACPVDPKTRALWLQQAQAKAQSQAQEKTTLPPNHPPLPPTANASLASKECSSTRITGQTAAPPAPTSNFKTPRPLSQEREVSSIPRSSATGTTALPANNESETGRHSSGNWIYPSESQFFNAVMQKQTASDPSALLSSIGHIIPIHNAVNERAWTLIRSWEGGASDSCGGPKLASFAGKGAGASTPRAKWNTWVMGKLEPFDRHDWVVERCDGQMVEYVIDFYQGKGSTGNPNDQNVNFFLDVRPKLNSFEGVRMRAERMLGQR
ncbi:uncharacterized protein HMPREF1541_00426 [Cyphellophora europaea CBS 101466]|uniref:Holocytochrome c-type synthase n=1 Tax=Cyphellophora europaea (strain CBS 101466) TaxID=1220924 RepID=W2SC05_CYPE1|nr:uncharacterized protein HMPREF1541_00426 [Cyphellophora europaea CBS 101466]ETN46242.1 hypothetical protein HMPREF1541_00426 [Cyphellophora europaea CBS 101466]